ncbi:DNA repair protein [uncultured Streptococcus sp.]|uniref:DNA repair protein n=1 Tax=uncultured Streptococcus sp. TaxID=83427 RepID=UPI0027DD9708|nr:DNA repair protein [uncultured Streptococcus sp.]
MRENNLKKLKRIELYEIMLAQSKEIDRLREHLSEVERQLEDKTIKIEQSGSLAEASLQLTHIFEEAQRAADLYLANIKQKEEGDYEER